jgi:hypothetical protein
MYISASPSNTVIRVVLRREYIHGGRSINQFIA